ncbi:hypothetical protein SJ782_06270 [Enterococcus faecium]
MKNFDTYYVIVFSISLLLILLTLMQYKEYPEYFILTFVYLVSSYTLLYKFRSSSRVSKGEYKIFCVNEKIHTKKEVPSVE